MIHHEDPKSHSNHRLHTIVRRVHGIKQLHSNLGIIAIPTPLAQNRRNPNKNQNSLVRTVTHLLTRHLLDIVLPLSLARSLGDRSVPTNLAPGVAERNNSSLTGRVATDTSELLEVELLLLVLAVLFEGNIYRAGECRTYDGVGLMGVRNVQRLEEDLGLFHGQTRELFVLLVVRHD